MKNVEFGICNGLNGVVHAGTEKEVELAPGMKAVLCLDKAEVTVEITELGDDGKTCFGRVVKAEPPALEQLGIGNRVSFTRRNISCLH